MAVKETRSCDICGKEDEKILTLTFFDNELDKVVNVTDLCEDHFNRIRSYLRHNCPKVSDIK